jgi:hypothetical protein
MESSLVELLANAVKGKGKMIYAILCGSWAYNLNTPTSDQDLLAVYVADETGPLFPPKGTLQRTNPDYSIYELGTFCELLLKGNPKVIEPVFTTKTSWSTEEWQGLVARRATLLNQVTVQQYTGFATSALKDAQHNKGTQSKKWYHALRLFSEAERIARGLEPRVYLEGEIREHIMRVREGHVTGEQVQTQLDELQRSVDQHVTALPAQADVSILAEWLIELRCKSLLATAHQPFTERTAPADDTPLTGVKQEVAALLTAQNLTGEVLFVAPIGARTLFGNEVESEPDYVAVFVTDTKSAVNSLKPIPSTIYGNPASSDDKYKKGITAFEVEHAIKGLLSGNHVLTEAVFGAEQWQSPIWKELLKALDTRQFLSQGLVLHYLGVSEGLLKKAEKLTAGTELNKCLYLGTKFVYQAQKLLDGHVADQQFTETQLTALVNCRTGHVPADHVPQLLTTITTLRNSRATWQHVITKTDASKNVCNDWLIRVRKTFL